MFNVLNITTNHGSTIEQSFKTYEDLRDYENSMRDAVNVFTTEVKCYENENEFKKELNDDIKKIFNGDEVINEN
jgi:hypothetical protein